jgi:hypothetical protein
LLQRPLGDLLSQDKLGQRLQSPLPGDGGPGAPLGFVGQVEVLHLLQHHGCPYLGLQLWRQFALLGDALQHRLLALLQVAQVFQTGLDSPELLLVQPAGDLLAVAGDEGQRVARVEQLDRSSDLFGAHAQVGGDLLNVVRGCSGLGSDPPLQRVAQPE